MSPRWETRRFEDCIERVTYTTKVQRKDFLDEGKYPIVSQEDDFINGYWNKEADLFRLDRPAVIFGDHTRTLKYVDFDFVLGADGVKVLKPKTFLHPKFFYHQLHTAKLDSLGYARHYRLLKEHDVSYPNLAEQQRIAEILDEAFVDIATVKAHVEKNLRNVRAIFEGHLQQIFNQQSELWKDTTLGEIYEIGSSRRVLKSQWKREGVPFYRGREVTRLAADGFVDNVLFISEEHYNELRKKTGVPRAGDIVITAIGTIGNSHVVRESDKFYFKDASVLWMKRVVDLSSEFIEFWLKSPLFFCQLDRGNGATVDTLTIRKLQELKIRIPPLSEQASIVSELGSIRDMTKRLEALYKRKLAALDELKQSLLAKAFAGKL